MSAQAQRIAQAEERARLLARMGDAAMAEAYRDILLDRRNVDFSPYLVTAMRDIGVLPRLEAAMMQRQEDQS